MCIEHLFSAGVLRHYNAGIESNVTVRNRHTQKRKNPATMGGVLLSIFLSEAFEKRTQRVRVTLSLQDHLLDISRQRGRRREESEGRTRAYARRLKHEEMSDQPLAREHDHLEYSDI